LPIGGDILRRGWKRGRTNAEDDADLLSIYLNPFDQGTYNLPARLKICLLQPCVGYLGYPVRHVTEHSTTEYRWGLERDPSGHGAHLELKGEGETSMPRKRLRTKTLSPRCCKTCEHVWIIHLVTRLSPP